MEFIVKKSERVNFSVNEEGKLCYDLYMEVDVMSTDLPVKYITMKGFDQIK